MGINFDNTPIPVILVLAGVLFLILSLGSTEALKILQLTLPRIPESQRWPARIMGGVLVSVGFVLTHVGPVNPTPQPPTEIVIRVESVPDEASQSIRHAYGLSEGEINAGSSPKVVFRNQETDLTAEEENAILEFVATANLAETVSYALSDPYYAALVYTGEHLRGITAAIEEYTSLGVYYVPLLHSDESYYTDIRMIDDGTIEVDGCEYWGGEYYSILDDELVGNNPLHLTPQTITIEYLDTEWYVTTVTFYDPPAFC